MKEGPRDFRVSDWPRLRDTVVNACDNARPHTVYGHTEVDFTQAYGRILEVRKATRVAVSIHAYVLACVARSAVGHPMLHAMRKGGKLVTFDAMDIGTVVDQHASDALRTRLPVVKVIRSADTKSFASVNWEIRAAARTDLGRNPDVAFRRKLTRLPAFAQRAMFRRIMLDPWQHRRFFGNLGFTSTQSPGYHLPMQAIVPNLATTTVAMGNLIPRFLPDTEGRPMLRKVLGVTGAFDHDYVDGMLVAAFGRDLARLIEGGIGLDDDFIRETRELACGETPR